MRSSPAGAGDRSLVITIDGPAGSGKSTTARAVADRLGLRHLDSGALYRAITLALSARGIPEHRWPELDVQGLEAIDLQLRPEEGGFRVLLEGREPGPRLRSPEVTRLVPKLAGVPAARERLLEVQRSAPSFGGLVADGRDMGTVIFPDADLKVFLTASLEERARRRLLQETGSAEAAAIREEAKRIRERDRADAERTAAPLRRPDDAFALDTTGLTFEAQIDRIIAVVPGLTGDAAGE